MPKQEINWLAFAFVDDKALTKLTKKEIGRGLVTYTV